MRPGGNCLVAGNTVSRVAVKDSKRIACHVVNRVRRGSEVYAVGLAGIPVIEPDNLPPSVNKHLHQLVRPADSLRRGAHDQQHHRISRVAQALRP